MFFGVWPTRIDEGRRLLLPLRVSVKLGNAVGISYEYEEEGCLRIDPIDPIDPFSFSREKKSYRYAFSFGVEKGTPDWIGLPPDFLGSTSFHFWEEGKGGPVTLAASADGRYIVVWPGEVHLDLASSWSAVREAVS